MRALPALGSVSGRTALAGLLGLLILASLPAASAAEAGGLILSSGPDTLFMDPGEAREVTFVVSGPLLDESLLLMASLKSPGESNWELQVAPERVVINPGDDRTFTVSITAPKVAVPQELAATFSITAVAGTEAWVLEEALSAKWQPTGLVLGRWENPLPSPLDGDVGVFILNLSAWLVIGLIAVLILDPMLRLLASRSKTDMDDHIIKIITRPTFILIAIYGVKASLESFQLPAWLFTTLDVLWGVALGLIITYVVYRVWGEVITEVGRKVSSRSDTELDDRLFPVFEKIGSVVIILGGLFYIIGSFGVNMAYFAAGGAAASLVIAFAAQDTLGNFFAGIFILLDRPFLVGHRVEIPEEQTWGDVVDIGLRSTRIRTLDNRTIIVPNSLIGNNRVINHSYPDSQYRLQTHVGVAYGTDVELARQTMVEAVKTVPGLADGRPVEALFLEFGDSALIFRVRWWISSYTDTRRHIDVVTTALEKAIREAGIEIPFPQRVLWRGEAADSSADAAPVLAP